MASSVPLRSLWRRSSRPQGCGRVKTRVRRSVWGTKSMVVAGHVEDTVPYPETWKKTTKTTDRNDYGAETDILDVELNEYSKKKKGLFFWSKGLFAICTLPFQPSSVTTFCLKTWMKVSCKKKKASCLRKYSVLNWHAKCTSSEFMSGLNLAYWQQWFCCALRHQVNSIVPVTWTNL